MQRVLRHLAHQCVAAVLLPRSAARGVPVTDELLSFEGVRLRSAGEVHRRPTVALTGYAPSSWPADLPTSKTSTTE